jgi:triosephosphate isomerase (TIM)
MSSERVPIIAGNWKMNLGLAEAIDLGKAVAAGEPVRQAQGAREVWVFPPAPFVLSVAQSVEDSPLRVGAQNVHVGEAGEQSGAYTGEWSPRMLRSAGIDLCLIGHSERRHVFGEDDALLNRKLHGAIAEGVTVCFCIGELLEERQAGRTAEVIATQLTEGLAGVSRDDLEKNVVLAYEPVWAIGTGQVASPEQAEEVHASVRGWLDENFGAGCGAEMRILYGGSVKPDNVVGLMALPDIDGALVGGASLKADSFNALIR